MAIVSLYKSIIDTLLLEQGNGTYAGKQAVRALRALYPDIQTALDQALRCAINGDITSLQALAESTLDRIGGAIRDYKMVLRPPEKRPLPTPPIP